MLQHRVRLLLLARSPSRFASRLSQSPAAGKSSSVKTSPTVSILSRLSDRTPSGVPRSTDSEQKSPPARVPITESNRLATSFVSARSAQQRDHAAEKWFTDVRKLDIHRSDILEPPPLKKRTGHELPRQHEMRPGTDLNLLFASPTLRSATSLRLQAKRELGGDYAMYLPGGYADPYRFPVNYARLVLGRNKHIPLNAQADALNIIDQAIRGKITSRDRTT